jgi:hypothetical protein
MMSLFIKKTINMSQKYSSLELPSISVWLKFLVPEGIGQNDWPY